MKQSAGILLYRTREERLEVFLCHPGGPFYKKKDDGAWTIPKGEFDDSEEPLAAARREFREETGRDIEGDFLPLRPVKYKDGRKIVYAWAVKGDFDPAALTSNTFPLEWPPRSGKHIDVPEVDKGEWFSIDLAKQKILPVLLPIIEEFSTTIKS